MKKEISLNSKSNSIIFPKLRLENKKMNPFYVLTFLIIILILTFLISFSIGGYSISIIETLKLLFSRLVGTNINGNTAATVLFKVRLPRIFSAIMIGAALSVSGASYQGLFKNPMVSPDILGASAGAGLGAALAILLSLKSFEIQLMSFGFGLAAVMLSYTISKIISDGEGSILSLVLTGMIISTLCSSFISLIKYIGDPYNKLPEITFWLMGGLSAITVKDTELMLIPMLIGTIPLVLLRWNLNALSFGDEEASSLGINTKKIRFIIIICSTLITAVSVSVGGIIGWVGLIIPHLSRMLVGPNYKILIPTSLIVGGIYLLLVDDIARSFFTMEIPLGILTSLIGAPFFIYLLLKGKKGWI